MNSIPWHSMSVSETAGQLQTDLLAGLSTTEVQARLEQFGPNVVSRGRGKSRLLMFLSQFTNPLVIVLLGASAITAALGDYIDTGVILAVVIINAVIGYVQEGRAQSAIESLSKLLTVDSAVLRDGTVSIVAAENLVPGDVVVLQSGDKVPADIRLTELRNLHIDESILTGESATVSKSTDPVKPHDPVADRTCMSYSGTLVTAGSGKGIVVATGDATEIGRISRLITTTAEVTTPLTRKLAGFGSWLSVVILVVAALTFVLGVFLGEGARYMFSAAVAMAVAAIPEGLPAIITIILAVGVKRMASRSAIIRILPSVETLGSVSVICSDKTGTLTANEMTVRRIHAGDHEFELSGIGYDPRQNKIVPVDTEKSELHSPSLIECLRCGILCNESELIYKDDEWVPNGDPTEVALLTAAMKAGMDPEAERCRQTRIDVIPFESVNMYMATLNEFPDGTRVIYVKGSFERILGMSTHRMTDDRDYPLDSERIQRRTEDLALEGFRTLAFARKIVAPTTNTVNESDLTELTFLGILAISDPTRPEAIDAVRECKGAGIEVKMITGDHVSTARAVARDMGIGGRDPKAITGAQLMEMDEEQFSEAAVSSSVFARVSPEQKYRLVESLQNAGKIVAMTGDGVNDAPALKKADIGVAMGKIGSDVAKDASDMVLADDNFASIVAAVEEGRTVFANLRKSLAFLLPTNTGQGLIVIAALVFGYTIPVTPVQILWINTVTTVTLALPLAFEPREQGIMRVPPRDPGAPIVSNPIILRLIIVGLYIVVSAFVVFVLLRANGTAIEEARTAAVTTIVAVEAFYLFQARSELIPIWKLGFFTNPYVWIGVPLVALFQLAFVYLPIMNFLFDSAPLTGRTWTIILLTSLPVVAVVGVEKAIRRKMEGQPVTD